MMSEQKTESSKAPKQSRKVVALSFVVLLILVLLTVAGAYFLMQWFSTLQREVATAIITGFGAVVISIVSVLLSKHYERKRSIEEAQRAKKAEIYEDLLKFVFSHVFASKFPDQVPSEVDGMNFFNTFTQRAIVWGSDDVLKQYARWKFSMNNPDQNSLVFEMEKLFFEIRKDMGHKNAGLRRGDILKIFTPDIEEHL